MPLLLFYLDGDEMTKALALQTRLSKFSFASLPSSNIQMAWFRKLVKTLFLQMSSNVISNARLSRDNITKDKNKSDLFRMQLFLFFENVGCELV